MIQETVKETVEASLKSREPAVDVEPPHEHAPSPTEDLKLHKDYAEALDCPECYPKIRGLIPSLRERFKQERKDKSLECVNCGVGVDAEEKDCPWCGSKRARRRK